MQLCWWIKTIKDVTVQGELKCSLGQIAPITPVNLHTSRTYYILHRTYYMEILDGTSYILQPGDSTRITGLFGH